MSEDGHDIGKILGRILLALGSRELLAFIHKLVVGSTMPHLPMFQMLVIGIGLYSHKLFAWMFLFAMMAS